MNASGHERTRFVGALERAFEMEPDDAQEIADVVLETFHERDEVDDETLDADIRSVFYTLESKRMLSFRRVELTRETGEKRRAFYWRLRHEAFDTPVRVPVRQEEQDVYAMLPSSAWHHAA